MKHHGSIMRHSRAMNASSKARMRSRVSKASDHSPVRILVQGGVDVSSLNITIEPDEVRATKRERGFKKGRRRKGGKTNPAGI